MTEFEGALIVLIPAEGDPTHAASSQPAHMTTVWFGDENELAVDREELEQAVRLYAQDLDGPVVVPVKERGLLGDDDADVVFLEPTDSLIALRDGLMANEPIATAHDAVEQHPQWTPHVTLGYPEEPAVGEYDATEVTFDRIGLWIGDEYLDFPMGGGESVTAAADIAPEDEPIQVDTSADEDEPDEDEDPITEIPVHGVLAPEGVETGDGRGFRPDSLTTRKLPVPLRLEIVGSHGGNNTSEVVTVGRVDKAWREGNEMRWSGAIILSKEHAHAAIQGIIDGSGTGVSIDADNMSVDMSSFSDEAVAEATAKGRNPTMWFSETRIAGLTIVPIPAFEEAFIDLGLEFEEDMTEEQLVASAAALEDCGCTEEAEQELEQLAADAAFAPGTKDGPGWITHPVPTKRIRDYWTKGKGAAKIGWGAPGDFRRCERLLRKYVQNPEWLAGLCANMHKEVNGFWPGDRRNRGRHALMAAGGQPANIITITAAGGSSSPITTYDPALFTNPGFTRVSPLRIDRATGHVSGHLAAWGVCHIGIQGACVEPPRSLSSYANFLKGIVPTTSGEQSVGCLTYGIGHANPNLRAAAATAHYDKPDAVWAYVNIGEDAHGIWFSGVLRPGVTEEMLADIQAIGSLSGDWRAIGRYGLDLVAAVSVNTPGYALAASGGVQTTVLAAGYVPGDLYATDEGVEIDPPEQIDENQRYLAALVEERVADVLDRRARTQELRSRVHALRVKDARARAQKVV